MTFRVSFRNNSVNIGGRDTVNGIEIGTLHLQEISMGALGIGWATRVRHDKEEFRSMTGQYQVVLTK
jgi:hypothetical protein